MMLLTIAKNANLGLLFFLELGVLVALAYWGFSTGPDMPVKIGLGLGAPVLAVIVWALFGAPRATWHLHGLPFLLLRILFFGSAALALFSAGQRIPGLTFALIVAICLALVYAWGQ